MSHSPTAPSRDQRPQRIACGGALWAINRPQLVICDPDDHGTVIALHYGNGNSDPVFWISVYVPRPLDWPFVRWSHWRWDRKVAKQRAA